MLQREQHGRRVGQAAGLDEHAAKWLDLPAQRQHEQVPQRIDHRAADRAAQAAALDQHDVVLGQAHQVVVHAHVAILVDDHHRVRIGRFLQQAVEQRRLAAAQKPGQYGHADAFSSSMNLDSTCGIRRPHARTQSPEASARPRGETGETGPARDHDAQTRDASQARNSLLERTTTGHCRRPAPPASWMQGPLARSTTLATAAGGPGHENRASESRHRKQASKTGTRKRAPEKPRLTCVSGPKILAPRAGLEPATCGLTVRRSTD